MGSPAGLGSLLPPEAWQALLANGMVRRFGKGEILMRQGEPGSHVFVLARGRVKVARVDTEGNELLLALRGVGDIVGELAVLGGGARSATVTALVPCLS
jgi:CRP/FNR family transcriptional regulator, cyclic AMP receptor protein